MCGWKGYTFQASKYMNGYHFHIKSIWMGYLFHPKSIWMGKIWKIVYEWVCFFLTSPSIWIGRGPGTPVAHPYPKSWQVNPPPPHVIGELSNSIGELSFWLRSAWRSQQTFLFLFCFFFFFIILFYFSLQPPACCDFSVISQPISMKFGRLIVLDETNRLNIFSSQ